MAAYINLIAYTTVTIYQLYLIWTNRHIRQRYGRSRLVTLWTCLLITLYFAGAYTPIALGRAGPEFAPAWIRPFFWFMALAVGLLAWYIHNDQLAQEEAAAERAEFARLRDEYVRNFAHEVRTRSTLILGNVAILRDDLIAGSVMPAELQLELLTAVHNAARHRHLIDQRLIAGTHKYAPEDVEIVALIAEIVRSEDTWLATRKRPGQVALQFDDAQAAVTAWVDRAMLRMALFDLVHNAIKFGKDGGFVVILLDDGEELRISVIDDGEGIAAEDLPFIWDPLRQVNGRPVRRFEGAGLGLWSARKLVGIHGGRIEVESEPGQGSVFTVRLPR